MYSAISGEYDQPAKVKHLLRLDVTFVMFTDSSVTANEAWLSGWDVKSLKVNQRLLKANPWRYSNIFGNADIILWIDGSIL